MSEIKTIITAAGKAIGFWIIVHMILLHTLIVLKWDSTNETIGTTTTTNSAVESDYDYNNDNHHQQQKQKQQYKLLVEIKQQLHDAINDGKQRLEVIENERTVMNNVIHDFTIVQDQLKQLHTTMAQEKKTTPEMFKLIQLLQIKKLSNVRSAAQFTKYVTAATNEIENQLRSSSIDTIDWLAYTELFNSVNTKLLSSKNNDKNESTEFSDGTCSSSSSSSSTTNRPPTVYATHTDVQKAIATIKERIELSEDSSGLPFFFSPETRFALQEAIRTMVQTKVQQQQQQHEKNENGDDFSSDSSDESTAIQDGDDDNDDDDVEISAVCLRNEDVEPWIEAGLDAMYRNRNVRTAILDAITDSGFDPTNIILPLPGVDGSGNVSVQEELFAYMTSSTKHNWHTNYNRFQKLIVQSPTTTTKSNNNNNNNEHQNRKVNVRQILDIPAVHETVAYLDTIFDYVSGQHDSIDDFIEKFILTQIPASIMNEPDMISKTFVQYLFNITGQLDIAIPDVFRNIFINRKAGLLTL